MSKNPWVVIVDDTSPLIQYNGRWSRAVDSAAYEGTLSRSSTTGSSATFSFVGNFVAVQGLVFFADVNDPPISTYSIDGQTPGIFIPTLNQNNSIAPFFASPQLSSGNHTLKISVAAANSIFFLDAILFNATSVSDVQSGGAQPTIITTIIAAPTSAPDPSAASSSGKSSIVGPIIGGVIGAAAILLFVVLGWFFYTRRRRRNAYERATSAEYESKGFFTTRSNHITPFTTSQLLSPIMPMQNPPSPYSPPPLTQYAPSAPSVYSGTTAYTPPPSGTRQEGFAQDIPPVPPLPPPPTTAMPTPPGNMLLYPSEPGGSGRPVIAPLNMTLALTPAQRKAQEARQRRQRAASDAVRQHTDSGYRFEPGPSSTSQATPLLAEEEPVEELPPTYSEQ
ncbi:hypothetical protein BDW22DRAFT_14923 [Trametopsis cervina]|nr:hypothetical protein BDW22DRAFT_14923 [Trametopsis cervina]